MTRIELLSTTCEGDQPFSLTFPEAWEVTLLGGGPPLALTDAGIIKSLQSPVGSRPLREIAAGRKSALLLVDDSSRPTPVDRILPFVLRELESAGLGREKMTILVAGGTHAPATPSEIIKKLGPFSNQGVRTVSHDCRGDLVDLGRSDRGTPILVNRLVVEADVRVGIGAIYPHPAAGFSGGSKILVPGACGADTVTSLHASFRAARTRGASPECEFRKELEEIARRIGLDWVVNVALTHAGEVGALFAGDPIDAHREGVRQTSKMYAVEPVPSPDIVITDLFPFDVTLQMAHDRGIWPLFYAGGNASRVLLAACPGGLGSHELFPVSEHLTGKVRRRIKNLRLSDATEMGVKLRRLRSLVREKRFEVDVVSPNLSAEDVRAVFPKGRRYAIWKDLLGPLTLRHRGNHVRVALYRSAPLLLPV